jgi:UMF1 family MFS transporter
MSGAMPIAHAGASTGFPTTRAPNSALAGWVLVDFALQPFHTLIVTFLFAPYFTNAVAPDPVSGQAWWGYAAAVAGVVIALGGPILGAMADRGSRKPMVAAAVLVMALASCLLWIARPGADGTTILLVLAAFVIATAAAEYMTVFTNSLMPTLVPPSELGRLSGASWAVAYTGGLVALILMAGFIVSAPGSPTTLMGLSPILTLDAGERQGDRLTGPFAAIWLLIFILPFFLFTPEPRARASGPQGDREAPAKMSFSQPLKDLGATLKLLPSMPSMLYFLLARALYTDGLSAVFVFGGIYGSSVFGWQIAELGMFGIVLIVIGVAGATIGGFLDDRLGSKTVILAGLVVLMVGAVGILSVTQGHVLYTIPVAPKTAGSAVFSSAGEQVFLLFAGLVALASAPTQSASRSLLARLAPPDRTAQFFGLFAFSGKVTAFAAPLLIAVATQLSGSQRLGMATVLIFFIAGIALMMPVRERET